MATLALQRCLNHDAREAIARCPECGQFFCRECITEHDERVVCASCLKKVAHAAGQPARGRVTLWPVLQSAGGLVLACFVFYTIGRMLLALPDSFHDGSMWELDFSETQEE